MRKIVSREQMRAIEQSADASGLSYAEMMSRAGSAVAEHTIQRVGDVDGKRVAVLVGSGNNGGDALVAGRLLAERGATVGFYLTKSRDDGDANFQKVKDMQVLTALQDDDQRWRVLRNLLGTADIVVDGVLGTGFSLPLVGPVADLLSTCAKAMERQRPRPWVVAIDCPSGVDVDSGEASEHTIPADLTVTLGAVKPGLLHSPATHLVGELVVGDIGLDPEMAELKEIRLAYASAEDVRDWLPPRPADSHKGTYGRVVIAAGCTNFPGAAALAGLGAYRVGVGLVTLAVPAPVQAAIVPLLPEATWVLLPHETGVISEAAAAVLRQETGEAQALLIGPGIGHEDTTLGFMARLLGQRSRGRIGFLEGVGKPQAPKDLPACVIDADGLRLLIRIDSWPDLLPAGSILTPHPGEMAVMTGMAKDEVQRDRIGAATHWAKTWGHIVVLKGAYTVVAAPDESACVMPFATAALARGGTGDVLAGAIAGLLAQGVPSMRAAILGAFLHGHAGVLAAGSLQTSASVLAGEVADALPEAIACLEF
jgi:hydroxyethylthiazole kinase-like uncharacterized protein yjeF